MAGFTIKIDRAGFAKLEAQLARAKREIAPAIARGLNEGGDLTRTRVFHALQKQSGLLRYGSVTSRASTQRAYPTQLDYIIHVRGKPSTKPNEFPTKVIKGRGGGVDVKFWGVDHLFARSFQQKFKGGLRARLGAGREPVRGFDGPNLAEEAAKGETPKVFLEQAARVVEPAIIKHLIRALGGV